MTYGAENDSWPKDGMPPAQNPSPYAPPEASWQVSPTSGPGADGTHLGQQSWQSGGSPAPGQQWAPAPRPGLFPLRPLAFGDVLGATFRLFRTSPVTTLGSAILVLGVTSLLAAFLPVLVALLTFPRLETAAEADVGPFLVTSITLTSIAALLGAALTGVGGALLQGILVRVVSRGAVGEKVGFKEAWGASWRRLLPLIGYAVIVAVASFLIVVIGWSLVIIGVALLIPAISSGDSSAGGGVAVLIIVGVLLGLASIALLIWLGVKIMFAPSAIVLEGLGPIAAMRRSWSLSDGSFWRVLGVVVVIQVILSTASGAVSGAMQLVTSFGTILLDPLSTGGDLATGELPIGVLVLSLLMLPLQIAVSAVVLVLSSGNATILYFDLRMRKEALGVTLQRYAELTAAGKPVPDEAFVR